jgi:hypothetical protein
MTFVIASAVGVSVHQSFFSGEQRNRRALKRLRRMPMREGRAAIARRRGC